MSEHLEEVPLDWHPRAYKLSDAMRARIVKSQPRWPRGHHLGGQWRGTGSASGTARAQHLSREIADLRKDIARGQDSVRMRNQLERAEEDLAELRKPRVDKSPNAKVKPHDGWRVQLKNRPGEWTISGERGGQLTALRTDDASYERATFSRAEIAFARRNKKLAAAQQRVPLTAKTVSKNPAPATESQRLAEEQMERIRAQRTNRPVDPLLRLNPDTVSKILESGLDVPGAEIGPDAIRILGGKRTTAELYSRKGRGFRRKVDDLGDVIVEEDEVTVWSEERRPEMERLAAEYRSDALPSAQPTVMFFAGPIASGKSSTEQASIEKGEFPENAVRINLDELTLKNSDYKKLAAAGEPFAALAVRAESMAVAKMIKEEALAKRQNMAIETTANGDDADDFLARARALSKEGYDVNVRMTDVPTNLSIERAVARAEKDRRFSDIPGIRASHRNAARNHLRWRDSPSINSWELYNTEGKEPVLIARGGQGDWEVNDAQLYDEFVAKAFDDPSAPLVAEVAREDSLNMLTTSNIEEAVEALAAGRPVQLRSKREVSVLIERLAQVTKEMKAKGEDAPTFDLCKVTVKGTNLFCIGNKGVPRIKMPQLAGDRPVPGSKADKLPRDSRGNVDIGPFFRQWLEKERGVSVVDGSEKAAYLKASQRELNGAKVAGIMGALLRGVNIEGNLFVSNDNYVVDGHHRWAATIGADYNDNEDDDMEIGVSRINLSITELLALANRFAEEWGLPNEAVGANNPLVPLGAK